MNIVLIGFTATGKTVVGRRLAKRLGWQLVDIDARIEEQTRMSIAQLFASRGEPVFRRLERSCIARAVKGSHQVIATGGGAFADPVNRRLLQQAGRVVCLSANAKTILTRLGRQVASRPLLKGAADPLERVQALYAKRAASYARADFTVETSQLSVDEVLERVWDLVSPLVCSSWQYLQDHMDELSERFGGKYVVVTEDRVIGSGGTQLEAYQKAARHLKGEQETGIYYLPLPQETLTAL